MSKREGVGSPPTIVDAIKCRAEVSLFFSRTEKQIELDHLPRFRSPINPFYQLTDAEWQARVKQASPKEYNSWKADYDQWEKDKARLSWMTREAPHLYSMVTYQKLWSEYLDEVGLQNSRLSDGDLVRPLDMRDAGKMHALGFQMIVSEKIRVSYTKTGATRYLTPNEIFCA